MTNGRSVEEPSAGACVARRRGRAILVAAVVAVTVAVVVALGIVFALTLAQNAGSRPSGFSVAGAAARIAPGSLGCRSIPGNVCYSTGLIVGKSGVTLSDVVFDVANQTDPENPQAPRIPLGPGAEVTMFGNSSSVVGTYNMSSASWTSGGEWQFPVDQAVGLILDTGLTSNATLSNAMFWATVASPYLGSVGEGLY
jgi:hypothetical protein